MSHTPVAKIEPTSGWSSLGLSELWAYREVIFFLGLRDIKIRYKQTIFGASWAILQPLLTMVVFTIIFGRVAKIPTDGIPYPLFSYAALVPWTFFANSVNRASNSLVGGGNMIKQIYFPRLAIPLSSVIGNGFDLLLASSVLLVLMAYYDIWPTIYVIWLPALVLLAFVTAIGVSLVLTAMNVQYRDVRHAVPFLVQIWMFASPVVYPLSVIENPTIKILYALNPMVGVVEGFRWALVGANTPLDSTILISVCVSISLLIIGLFYFKRMERSFADVV